MYKNSTTCTSIYQYLKSRMFFTLPYLAIIFSLHTQNFCQEKTTPFPTLVSEGLRSTSGWRLELRKRNWSEWSPFQSWPEIYEIQREWGSSQTEYAKWLCHGRPARFTFYQRQRLCSKWVSCVGILQENFICTIGFAHSYCSKFSARKQYNAQNVD